VNLNEDMKLKTPFHKILIANRGEIALRVMRTAKRLGFQTVAVFSSADRNALHVRMADEAVHIGEASPKASYMHIENIIAAARASHADAVHPGYGFLAENAAFARACRDSGLVYIGPPAEAMDNMGSKAAAKRLMLAAGVPCVPGYHGTDQSDSGLLAEAERIGFPVMIKALAGGGGRGMRLANEASQFESLLHSAQSEADAAFGNSAMILERAIREPRHIEIQIFADRYGNTIHMGERDCSVQRRHQKVIEEAPSPIMSSALRESMGATAVAAAKAIEYEGAGTVEFLLDSAGSFYFMEMNTRLQVEHPVTEYITGIDLVELQIKVASGEPLPVTQDAVRLNGHSIEVRLCAEDPHQSFLPQSGVMTLWQVPPHVRVEHALESGTEISAYYDSMIAKLVSHGTSRDEARRKLITALDHLVALGVTTNQSFLSSCLKHPEFAAGNVTTAFIDLHEPELLKPDAAVLARVQALVPVLLYATAEGWPHWRPSTITHHLPISLCFQINDAECSAQITNLGGRLFSIQLTAQESLITLVDMSPQKARFEFDGLLEEAALDWDGSVLLLQYRGMNYTVNDKTFTAKNARKTSTDHDGNVLAAFTGHVAAIHVVVGEEVEIGQPLFIIEAMKMEYMHSAPISGTVVSLGITVGEHVSVNRIIAELKSNESEAAAQGSAPPDIGKRDD